jgi:hypothetical protein
VRRKPPSAAAFGFNRINEAHNKYNVAKASFGTEPHEIIIAFLGINIVGTALAISIIPPLVEHIADPAPVSQPPFILCSLPDPKVRTAHVIGIVPLPPLVEHIANLTPVSQPSFVHSSFIHSQIQKKDPTHINVCLSLRDDLNRAELDVINIIN